MNPIIPIGLDVGFGDVKAVQKTDGTYKTVSFPAILGHAQDLTNFNTGLGGSRRRTHRLVYDGVEYYVGHEALRHSRTQAGRQDRTRIGSLEERVLALAALAQLLPPSPKIGRGAGGEGESVFLVTGLPVLWFDDRRKLARSLKGRHIFTWGKHERCIDVVGVTTVPQPLGGFYNHVLDEDGRAILSEAEMLRTYAFFDIGFNTTDLTAIQELLPVDRWCGGERVGVRNVIEIVGDQLQRRYGLSLQPHEIDGAIRDRRVESYGVYHDIGDLIDSAITALAQQEISTATRLWGNGERMSRVLIFGGGAAFLGPTIRRAFPNNGLVLAEPALANALGFCKFAQRKRL
jgi:hypothetical protein